VHDAHDDPVPTGLSATLGGGLRIPVVRQAALLGGLDFHADKILGVLLRDWTWSIGIAVTP
jgi:hypothetical protein